MAKGDIFTGRLPKRQAKGRDRPADTGESGVCGGINFVLDEGEMREFRTPCFYGEKK